ncbi:MAG: ROK family transcriptional regulator [Microbacterium gubbeenense]|uniref:ROK family transcriptional regulator n=1 Tax=Microbacterium gubbeenense TaxID=159896 RepID=UPI0004266B5A|nr:ROK family transcriptional regulator [Microbacterium gubbeenense]
MSDTTSGRGSVGHLFQLLRDGAPRTRAELAKSTGLARSTIAARVDMLMSMGLVAPVADGVSTGGRPPSQFALNPAARLVIAADLGASHATVAITDLTGAILAEHSDNIAISDGPVTVLTWLVENAARMLDDAGRAASDIAAVGIGLPGPVEFSTGQPVNPPIMPGWDRFDVPGWVRQHFDAPVLVDNDVNISALGERAVAWPVREHLLFVKVATGIGAGIVSEGRLQRGAQGIAGDVGHVRIARGADIPCTCGNSGCLEALASGPALARTLRDQGLDAQTGSDVVDLVKSGNLTAIQAVRQAGRDIGEMLTVAVSLLNPSVIVIGGSMARVGEHLIAGVREIVYTRSTPLATEHLSVAQSSVGSHAAVVGASLLAVQYALSPEGIAAFTPANA